MTTKLKRTSPDAVRTGQALYEMWCGDTPGQPVSDRAKYWHMMNPGDAEAWGRLADELVVPLVQVLTEIAERAEKYGYRTEHLHAIELMANDALGRYAEDE